MLPVLITSGWFICGIIGTHLGLVAFKRAPADHSLVWTVIFGPLNLIAVVWLIIEYAVKGEL
jgi:hypothetical protein